jgi:hypothetical protein
MGELKGFRMSTAEEDYNKERSVSTRRNELWELMYVLEGSRPAKPKLPTLEWNNQTCEDVPRGEIVAETKLLNMWSLNRKLLEQRPGKKQMVSEPDNFRPTKAGLVYWRGVCQ